MATTNTDRIQNLEQLTIGLDAEFTHLKQTLTDTTTSLKEAEKKIVDLATENALLKQRLEDHLKRMDTWSGRLWGFIVLLIGAVLSLSSGLIVTLVRK